MKERDYPKFFWRTLEFEVKRENAIIQIDEKILPDVERIVSANTYCIPKQIIVDDIMECGELSLSVNNKSLLHINSNYTNKLPDYLSPCLMLLRKTHPGSRIKGYYRDNGKMRNLAGDFIPYRVKILMDCSTLNY